MRNRVLALSPVAAVAAILLAAAPAFAAESYKIDPVHSTVQFGVDHLGIAKFWGRFNEVAGTIAFDEKDPSQSKVTLEIAAASVDTNNKKRDDHLRGPDFFNAKQFPKITFVSKKVVKKSDDTFEVTGDLTVRGTTKTITVPVKHTGAGKDPWGGFRRGFEASFTINRLDYGVSFMPEGLGKDVTIVLAIEAIKS